MTTSKLFLTWWSLFICPQQAYHYFSIAAEAGSGHAMGYLGKVDPVTALPLRFVLLINEAPSLVDEIL